MQLEQGTPHEWMRCARADLAFSRIELPPDAMYEQLCFHAQQAAEKAPKAVLQHRGIDFPHVEQPGAVGPRPTRRDTPRPSID